MYLVRLGTVVLFVTPAAFRLYFWRDGCRWGQTISTKVWRRGTICLAVMKRAASYDLSAEDMADLVIWEIVRSETLLDGMETSSEINMWDPARLRALISLGKDVSEYPEMNMLLVW